LDIYIEKDIKMQYHRQARSQVTNQKDLGLDERKLSADIFTIIRSGDTDDDIQISLVELLGYEALDFITDLISHRSTIVRNIIRMSDYDEQHSKGRVAAPAPEAKRPVYGTQFIVQSEKELREEKRLRKEQKRATKNQNRTEGKIFLRLWSNLCI
jgi:hypothetical protein